MSDKMFYSADSIKDDATGEVFDIEQPDAYVLVERLLSFNSSNDDLVAASIKLPSRIIRCLENNSKILGISKSELHRRALEIGINEITRAYENFVNSKESTTTVVD